MRELGKEYEERRNECEENGECKRRTITWHFVSLLTFVATGYDVAVFDAVLPTTTPIQRADTREERVQALVDGKQVARASGLFRLLGSMMYNGDEILEARTLDREVRQKAKDAKKKEAEDKEVELFEEASFKYQLFVEKGRNLNMLKADDLTPIVKFLCAVDSKGKGDCISNYKTNAKKIDRIMNTPTGPWVHWLDSQYEEEAEGAVEPVQAEAAGVQDGEMGAA